jgi:hypothetical protein
MRTLSKRPTYCSDSRGPIIVGGPPDFADVKPQSGAGNLQVGPHTVGIHGGLEKIR